MPQSFKAYTLSEYLHRLDALPERYSRSLNDLKIRIEESKQLSLSIGELLTELNLGSEVLRSYDQNRKSGYAAVSKILESVGLKCVPCFIPSSMHHSSTIYVVPAPVLHHDEDVAAVQALLKRGTPPTSRDQTHILRMNEKLSNYNLLLRLFEALFVVCQGPLSSHQRPVLASLLATLPLPHEGRSYLRQCFTYAAEVGCPPCDYRDPAYCFKPLSEQQDRLNDYLLELALLNNYYQLPDPSYPAYEELKERYHLSYVHAHGEPVMPADSKSKDASVPASPSTFTGHELILEALNQEHLNPLPRLSRQQLIDSLRSNLYRTLRLPECFERISDRIARAFNSELLRFVCLEEKLEIFSVTDSLLEHKASHGSVLCPHVAYTTSADLARLWPGVLYVPKKEELHQTLTKISYRGYEYLQRSDSGCNMNMFMTLLTALILRPLLYGIEEDPVPYLTAIDQVFARKPSADLLFIRVLHCLLFRLHSASSPSKLCTYSEFNPEEEYTPELTELDLLGFMNFPELLNGAVSTLLLNGEPDESPLPTSVLKLLLLSFYQQVKVPRRLGVQPILERQELQRRIRAVLDFMRKYRRNSLFDFEQIRHVYRRERPLLPGESTAAKFLEHPLILELLRPWCEPESYLECTGRRLKPRPKLSGAFSRDSSPQFDGREPLLKRPAQEVLQRLNRKRLSALHKSGSYLPQLFTLTEIAPYELLDALGSREGYLPADELLMLYTILGIIPCPFMLHQHEELFREMSYCGQYLPCTLHYDDFDDDFIVTAECAQYAVIVYRKAVGSSPRWEALLKGTRHSRAQQSLLKALLKSVNSYAEQVLPDYEPRTGDAFYTAAANNQIPSECLAMLRILCQNCDPADQLQLYRLKKLEPYLWLEEALYRIQAANHLPLGGSPGPAESSFAGVTNHSRTIFPAVTSRPLSSSPSSSAFSLDTQKVRSKLEESAKLQQVIAKIIGEEEPEEELPRKAVPYPASVPDLAAGATPEAGIDDAEPTRTADPALNSQEISDPRVRSLLMTCRTLEESVELSLFERECKKAGFMSSAQALEIVNELGFERFDAPLIESDESTVYLDLGLIEELTAPQ